jgi:hypothetical protein
VGVLFWVGALGWLLAAIRKGDTVYWVMFSSNFVLGLVLLNAANARRRVARDQSARPPRPRTGAQNDPVGRDA